MCPQVDEQCVFRHRGERKVKTIDEDMADVTSSTAELLEDGEELIGTGLQEPQTNTHLYVNLLVVAFLYHAYVFPGDDSSNEGEGEDGGGDGKKNGVEVKVEKATEGAEAEHKEDGDAKELDDMKEEAEEDEVEGLEVKSDGESAEFSFPDTTISLSHLQSTR